MPFKDALHCVRHGNDKREKLIHLKPLGRNVTIRLGTSDLQCVEKVFLACEYRNPFPLKPKFIIDAGANIGTATLFFAREYPDAQIIAIEPEASNFNLLKRNCQHLPNVIPINAALWSSEQQLKIADPAAESWAFSIAAVNGNGAPSATTVAAVTVAGLFEKYGVAQIDLLKLDVEGAERELFQGNPEAWLGSVNQIIIELHDRIWPGCAEAFYKAVTRRSFNQEVRGENIFVRFGDANLS
jgi:FkbM family methyltransferase